MLANYLKKTDAKKSFQTINKNFYIALIIIFFSLFYRVEMSGKGFSFQGFFYRIFFVPLELIHKMI